MITWYFAIGLSVLIFSGLEFTSVENAQQNHACVGRKTRNWSCFLRRTPLKCIFKSITTSKNHVNATWKWNFTPCQWQAHLPVHNRYIEGRNSNRNLLTSKAPMNSQAQGTSTLTSAASIQRVSLEWVTTENTADTSVTITPLKFH